MNTHRWRNASKKLKQNKQAHLMRNCPSPPTEGNENDLTIRKLYKLKLIKVDFLFKTMYFTKLKMHFFFKFLLFLETRPYECDSQTHLELQESQ